MLIFNILDLFHNFVKQRYDFFWVTVAQLFIFSVFQYFLNRMSYALVAPA